MLAAMESRRSALLLAASLVLVVLAACNDARVPPTARAAALHDRTVREVRVVKVWDQVSDRLDADGDPHVSHYIEVDVVSGPDAGKQFTLPFDTWNVGKPPPAVGAVLVMAPADWVQRDPRSQGRAFGEW